jgi:hypothetical protein
MMTAMEAKHAIEHIRTELNKASKSGVQFIQVIQRVLQKQQE